MSVQAGSWNLDGRPCDRELLANISRYTSNYGPDGEETYFDGSIGMLYRPLHTNQESRVERQPHFSVDGKVITWDGRLDNRDELIGLCSDLRQDHTDVAVVTAVLERCGTDAFTKLIGEWAVSIWDSRERTLILARDYVGVRHLFYYRGSNRLIWCSHLAPLALCGDHLTVCDEYVAGYLAFHPDAHLTPYQEIRAVPPGKFIRVHNAGISVHPYWGYNPRSKTRYKTDTEYEEHYRHLFRQAVRRRLRTQSPVIAELSGGLDSSSIVCMADDILSKEGAETPRVDTFSYYDSNEPGEDDFAHLAKVEAKRGRRGVHADLRGSGSSLSFEYQSFSPTPGFGCRAEIKAALFELEQRHKYRVMLSGLGGDEMNGMPLDPCIQMADLLIKLRLVEMIKLLIDWSLRIRRPAIQLFCHTLFQFLPVSIRARLTKQGIVNAWVNPMFARKYNLPTRQLEGDNGWYLSPIVRDSIQTLATLSRVMTYTSPSVIEARYPYLDQTLVEFLTTIPIDQLLRPGQRRSLMRRALADLLPPEILLRRTKACAARCYSVALEKQWRAVESAFSSPVSSRLGYVERDSILTALNAMKAGQVPDYFLRLLKALSLELWLRDVSARGVIVDHSSAQQTAEAG
jgi:asparagine synthase (glutamine-hydrolysing)